MSVMGACVTMGSLMGRTDGLRRDVAPVHRSEPTKVSRSPESELVCAFRRGERKVQMDLYREHAEVVYRFLRDRLRGASDARDLMQEVFIAAFKDETRTRFSGESSFLSFLLGIARNLLMHHFRSDRIRNAGAERINRSLLAGDREVPSVDHAIEDKEVGRLLEGFVGELSPTDRDFFRSHMMERPARRITAERFAMTEDQVRYREKQLRARAVAYLKRVGYLDAAGATLQRAAAEM